MGKLYCGDFMFFDRIFELRELHDLHQKDIASILKIDRRTYSGWETGKVTIPLIHLNELCNYYKVSMDYIVGLSNNKNTIKFSKELNKTLIGKRILDLRNKHKLTQKDLASLLNTTSSTICSYENGNTLLLTSFAYQICIKYNLSMDFLCGRTNN